MMMASADLTKDINGEQLIAELKVLFDVDSDYPDVIDGVVTVEGTLTDEDLANAISNHVPDPDFLPPSPRKDWRDRLRTETAFLEEQISTWPPSATSTSEALQRVNFLLSATKRLARNQARMMRFLADATMDTDA